MHITIANYKPVVCQLINELDQTFVPKIYVIPCLL